MIQNKCKNKQAQKHLRLHARTHFIVCLNSQRTVLKYRFTLLTNFGNVSFNSGANIAVLRVNIKSELLAKCNAQANQQKLYDLILSPPKYYS
jgi:hypothetical protein